MKVFHLQYCEYVLFIVLRMYSIYRIANVSHLPYCESMVFTVLRMYLTYRIFCFNIYSMQNAHCQIGKFQETYITMGEWIYETSRYPTPCILPMKSNEPSSLLSCSLEINNVFYSFSSKIHMFSLIKMIKWAFFVIENFTFRFSEFFFSLEKYFTEKFRRK